MNAEERISFPQEYHLNLQGSSYILDDAKPTEDYLIAFSSSGAKDILKIYETYIFLDDKVLKLEEEVSTLKEVNEITTQMTSSYKTSLISCKDTISEIETDRNFMYNLYKETIEKNNKANKKKKIIQILTGVGGGLVGVGAGILIGIFAI